MTIISGKREQIISVFGPDIKMPPLKREDDCWLLIYVVSKKYVPVIDLNSKCFKQNRHQSSLAIKNRDILGMKKNQVLEQLRTFISQLIL